MLQNSLKFTFEGQICVDLNYIYETKELVLSVSDSGIGIKKEDQEKLFKMFGKLESTATINTSGVGLGLSICKNIIEGMSGSITLDTNYD